MNGIFQLRDYKKWLSRYDKENEDYVIAKCESPLDSKFAFKGTAVVDDEDKGLPGYVSETITIVKLL